MLLSHEGDISATPVHWTNIQTMDRQKVQFNYYIYSTNPAQKVSAQKVSGHKVSKIDNIWQKVSSQNYLNKEIEHYYLSHYIINRVMDQNPIGNKLLFAQVVYFSTFWMETFCPMLSILETLWPETLWPETFWADTRWNI